LAGLNTMLPATMYETSHVGELAFISAKLDGLVGLYEADTEDHALQYQPQFHQTL